MSNKKKTSITKTTTIASSSISSSSNNNNNNNNKASVRIIHAEPRIRVSEKEAHEIGKKDLMNLVKNKKLVLLVDLDHTLIHTTNENVRADLKVKVICSYSI
jgi:predicted secreted acid phosphatase